MQLVLRNVCAGGPLRRALSTSLWDRSSAARYARSPAAPPRDFGAGADVRPTTDAQLVRHMSALLTRHGSRGEPILAEVARQLRVRYAVPNPIQIAVDALKPVVKYCKSKVSKGYTPIALYPRTADGIALRWIVRAAAARTFAGGRPQIVRGLVEEIDGVIQGSSALFAKRFAHHRNPN